MIEKKSGHQKNVTLKKIKAAATYILVCSVLVSCGGETEEVAEPEVEKGHKITGNIEGAEGQEVKLMVFEGGKEMFIDSCIVVNGKYELNTKTKELREYVFFVGDDTPIILFLDEESDNVTVSGSVPKIGENYTVSGSKHSEDVRDYMLFLKGHYDVEIGLINQVNSINPEDTKQIKPLMARLDSISAVQRDYAVEFIMKDTTSPVSWMLLRELIPASGLTAFDSSDISYFYSVANGMRSKYPYSEYPSYIDQDIQSITAQYAAPVSTGLEEGNQVPEIVLNDYNEKPIPLSSLRGKVVLIDFWASWCMPCRQENPNVVRMYDKYKDKGFTVYSVSLDENKDAWMKAIDADNLSWPNHVSDLKGWKSEAAAAYNVSAIPATFLIDKEGNLIARNLRGADLEQKLQEILD